MKYRIFLNACDTMLCKMPDPIPLEVYGLISSIIISGGVAGAVFGLLRDIFMKKKKSIWILQK